MDECYTDQMLQSECERINAELDLKHTVASSGSLYTLHGILDYLQSEWAKMELERSEWAVERAEMQTRIAFLQAECKAQENLKADLVRRIKMLEYALLQERSKTFDMKFGNDTEAPAGQSVARSDQVKSMGGKIDFGTAWKQEIEHVKTYLTNAGLGDAMDQFRKLRVNELLSSFPSETSYSNIQGRWKAPPNPLDNQGSSSGGDVPNNQDNETFASSVRKAHDDLLPSSVSGLIQSLTELDRTISVLDDPLELADPATAEALAEFDLLVAQHGNADKVGDADHDPTSVPHLVKQPATSPCAEQDLLNRFKELYRAERHKGSRPATTYSDVLKHPCHEADEEGDHAKSESGTFEINDDIDVKRPPQSFFPTFNSCAPSYETGDDVAPSLCPPMAAPDPLEHWTAPDQPPSVDCLSMPRPNLMLDATSVAASSLGLGDLASLTVANESETIYGRTVADSDTSLTATDGNTSSDAASTGATGNEATPWTAKYTLRSHFDAIRAISFHPVEPILATASEDNTVKLWNLNKTVQAKKSTNFDVEPVYTFRGHQGPVLSLAMWSSPDSTENSPATQTLVISGDLHGRVRTWLVPQNNGLDPYDVFDSSVIGPLLRGHCDAVWALVTRSDGSVLSASADGTGCLWSLENLSPTSHHSTGHTSIPASTVFQLTTNLMTSLLARSVDFSARAPVPTSVSFVDTDKNRFLAGFTSGHICVSDLTTNQLISSLHSDTSTEMGAVTCLLAHPQHSLAISAHEDQQIRFYDLRSGNCVHHMVAHLDTVTSLSLDSQGIHLVSSSHDCSIRLWNINKYRCVQEITSHRKKFGESIHAVAFHPSKHLMASAGADALAKVYT